jgi:hypothetical protein
MKYRIRVEYTTGNSFGSEREEDYLELEWDKREVAKENLRRIKEHHDWYESTNNRSSWNKEEPLPKPKWIKSKYNHCLTLVTDGGKEMELGAFWVGYFEQLHGAYIEVEDDDMSFEIN